MAVVIGTDLSEISLCETVTNWTGAGGVNADFANQGTYCLGVQVKATTGGTIYYTPATPIICTNKCIYFWVLITGVPDTVANGGIRLYAYTDASNYGYWYVGGSDNYAGGWRCFVFDPSTTPTTGLGTVNPASIARIGIQFKTLSSIVGTTYNCFWDAVRYGTGLLVQSLPTDTCSFDNIYSVDNSSTYKYGVLTKEATGSYVLQGKLYLGTVWALGITNTGINFADTGEIIISPYNRYVLSGFAGIELRKTPVWQANFRLGEKSGDAGINGCILKANTHPPLRLIMSGVLNDSVKLYGTSLYNFDNIYLPPSSGVSPTCELLNCSIVESSGIYPSTAYIQSTNIISAKTVSGAGIILSGTTHNISNSSFISNPVAIRITASGTYEFDSVTFLGNTVDIDNTSGGPVVIDCLNGSDPSTSTGDTTINNAVTLTVQGVKTGSEPTNYVRCRIEEYYYGTVLMSEEATESYGSEGYYKATQSYNYPGSGMDVKVRARYKGYLPFETTGTITSAGITITAVWIEDSNYSE